MLNENKAVEEFNVKRMKEDLEKHEEPRLRYTILKKGGGIPAILTLKARDVLYQDNQKTAIENVDEAFTEIKLLHESLYQLPQNFLPKTDTTLVTDVDQDTEKTFLECYFSFAKEQKKDSEEGLRKKFVDFSVRMQSTKFPPSTDAFSTFENSYSYNSVIATALNEGKLCNYKIVFDKDLYVRIRTKVNNTEAKNGKTSKDNAYYILYLIAEIIKTLYKRYVDKKDEYSNHLSEEDAFVPIVASNFQMDLGISNADAFLNSIHCFEYNGKPLFKKVLLSNSRTKIWVNPEIFKIGDKYSYPTVYKGNEKIKGFNSKTQFLFDEEDGKTQKEIKDEMSEALNVFLFQEAEDKIINSADKDIGKYKKMLQELSNFVNAPDDTTRDAAKKNAITLCADIKKTIDSLIKECNAKAKKTHRLKYYNKSEMLTYINNTPDATSLNNVLSDEAMLKHCQTLANVKKNPDDTTIKDEQTILKASKKDKTGFELMLLDLLLKEFNKISRATKKNPPPKTEAGTEGKESTDVRKVRKARKK